MKKVSKNNVAAIAVAGSIIFSAAPVLASAPGEYVLDEFIVTATRTSKNAVDVPANVRLISKEEIKEGGYANVFEAVKNIGQMNVHTYQEDGGDYGGMMSRVRMRGIDNGTLVLVNGNPCTFMNNATLSSVPVEQIERIEIVKGAGSVLYGPQAMGGVVNIITKKPSGENTAHGNVYAGFGSRGHEAGVNVSAGAANLGFSKTWSKDFYNAVMPGITGKGTAINIKNKRNYQLYADFNIGKDLLFSYGRTDSKVQYESGNYKNFQPKMTKLGSFDTVFNNYSLTYNAADTGLKIFAGYNTISKDNVYDKSYPASSNPSSYKGYNLNFDVQKTIALNKRNDSLVLGTTLSREDLENYSGDKYNYNGRNSFSLYQSYDFHPTENLEFIVGLREYYLSKSNAQDKDFELLPQVQGVYKVNDKSNYYFNVGKSFQMPAVSSNFYYSNNYTINTDLKPQSGWSYEAGYKYEGDGKSVSADIFYMTVKDKFYWDKTPSGENIMRNRDSWTNLGLEINWKQKLNESFTWGAGLTLQDPVAKSDGKRVQDTSKYIVNLSADYRHGKFNAEARAFSYLSREDAYYNLEHTSNKIKDHKLKDSFDLTLALCYRPTASDTFRLVGRNLLNREDALNNYEYRNLPLRYSFTYEKSF